MRYLIVLLVLLISSGCATITRGTQEVMVIETTPPKASVRLSQNGEIKNCESPCSIKVKRRGSLDIEIEKEGFEPFETNVTSSIDGGGAAGMAGNVVLGGIIGAGVDAGSGAMHSHKPNPLVVTLAPVETESATGRRAAIDLPADEETGSASDPFSFTVGLRLNLTR
jgi:hypothetical protein